MPKLFGGGQFKTENLKKLYLQTDTKYNLKLEGGVIVGMFYQNGAIRCSLKSSANIFSNPARFVVSASISLL